MHRAAKQTLDQLLLQVVDGSLAGVIFLVPLLMGGRHAVGQLVLTALAVAAAWAWAARQSLRGDVSVRLTWATPLLLAGLGLVVLQIVPLPPSALAWLTPQTAEMLPLWNAGTTPAALGDWRCLSFTPAETWAGLVLLLDFVLLFFVTVQRVERIEDVERLLRWCALSAVCMAVFGIVQLLANNGKFFWFYQHPFSTTANTTHGSFTNRNHFAHFLALGIGPLIWWLQDAMRRWRPRAELKTYFLSLALGIVLFAGLLSLSRGGIAVMFLAAAVCTAVCYRASSLGGRFAAVLTIAGAMIGASLWIFGYEQVGNRLDDLSSGSLERLDRSAGRRNIWAAAANAAADRPLFGAGVGSFAEVYPMYTDALRDENTEHTHAEQCYLQQAVETGMPGLALTLAAMALIGGWCFQAVRSTAAVRVRVCAAAIAASMTAVAVHALVDFVWYVPACMAIVAVLAACVLQLRGEGRKAEGGRRKAEGVVSGQWPMASESSSNHQSSIINHHSSSNPQSLIPNPSPYLSPLAPLLWPIATIVLTLLGGWMIASRVGPALAQPYWDAYLVARHATQTSSPATSAEAPRLTQWIARLENVVRWQPTHARAHLALAETHRRLFDAMQTTAENQISLANVRDAAIQSRFPSREALTAWLSRAIGTHWVHLDRALDHTRQALALCPLQGRAYVYLAELSFLRGGDAAAKQACVQQALRVRPFDGSVLYAAGVESLLAGNQSQWLEYSKRAFRTGRQQQKRLINDLAANTPGENLPGLIDFVVRQFQPDLEGLRLLDEACAPRCRPEQLTPLTSYRAQSAEKQASGLEPCRAAAVWLDAQRLYGQLHDDDAALRCAGRAVESDPGNWNAHFALASCLLQRQSYAEAETHLRWCLQRTPNKQNVEAKFREALKGRLDGQRRAAAKSDPLR